MQNFEDPENWTGGPTFDLTLISEARLSGSSINELLLASGKFSLYSGSPKEKGMRTLWELSPNVKLPARHSHYWSTYRTPYFYYNFHIRPKVFQKYVGTNSYEDIAQIEDPTNLAILIEAFIEIVFLIKSKFSIEYATIADENDGRGHPDWRSDLKGIYISKSVCELLQIPSVPVDEADLNFSNSFIDVPRASSEVHTALASLRTNRLRQIVKKHDPAGLLALGAPSDEYDAEISQLDHALQSIKSSEALAIFLQDQYSGINMGKSDLLDRIKKMSDEIWSWQYETSDY
ncbi:MAG: hypothetical protein U0103_13025 [Candidatus Obscuribacterales bacterium]